MKYQIKYSLPYDIYRYTMQAKDEDQLVTFVKNASGRESVQNRSGAKIYLNEV